MVGREKEKKDTSSAAKGGGELKSGGGGGNPSARSLTCVSEALWMEFLIWFHSAIHDVEVESKRSIHDTYAIWYEF